MAQLDFPLVYCFPVPRCAPTNIPLPFGLPGVTLDNPCCQGIDLSLDQLNNLLAPLYPFLRLIGCAVELIQIVLAIPDAMGPPPSPGKIIQLGQHVSDFVTNCIGYIISLTPAGIIPEMACMLAGVCQFIYQLLICLQNVITVNVSISADALFCSQSTDPGLQAMGVCLDAQGANLAAALLDKLASLLSIFSVLTLIINILINAVPGLGSALQQAGLPNPIVLPNISLHAPITDPTILQNIAVVFQTLYSVFVLFCPGGVSQ